jgi:hypothetical protein
MVQANNGTVEAKMSSAKNFFKCHQKSVRLEFNFIMGFQIEKIHYTDLVLKVNLSSMIKI